MATLISRMHAYRNHLTEAQGLPAKETFLQAFKHLGNLEDQLIALFPQLTQGKVDNPFQKLSQVNVTPTPVQFTVQQKNGLSFVKITLPQQQLPQSQQLYNLAVGRGPNAPLSPLYHKLQSAASDSFDESAGVQTYDPSPQLFWTLPDANPHWRVQSSFDSVNFNGFSPSVKGIALP